MRLFMTDLGREAWYAALVRNVRMEITRFEVGALDIYTLSGDKQAGRTVQQFRANNYNPNWQPDIATVIANDTVGYAGSKSEIGYWRLRNNDGGLVLRVPASAPDMFVGNVRIYAKNTGPYPYPSESSPAYKQYQEVYPDGQGGEILLFIGFEPIANMHWKSTTEFPHFFEIRTSIYADGLFNTIDRNDMAFEADIKVKEIDNENDLDSHVVDGYSCVILKQHTQTQLPAVVYRVKGANRWIGYPLHEIYTPELEYPPPIADEILDNELLDFGTVDPPPINDENAGAVIASQPRRIAPLVLSFTKKDVTTWTFTSNVVSVNIEPSSVAAYYCRVRTLDFAFLGTGQQIYLVHNGTRHRLNVGNQNLNTSLIGFRHGDSIYLEGTLTGPISSITGQIYAELNEAPITTDPNNTQIWLHGTVSCHISATLAKHPANLDYGLTGRRLAGYDWQEFTPEQYISGVGYDLYGIPDTAPVFIRIKPSESEAGGTGYTFGAQQNDISSPSYLPIDYRSVDGNSVIRRGVTGLAGTGLRVFQNGTDMGLISTQENPEGGLTLVVKDNDRLSFKAELVGQAYNPLANEEQVLPTMALEVQGISNSGASWLQARFDIAATFGPDVTPNEPDPLPVLPPLSPLPNMIAAHSFDNTPPEYAVDGYKKETPSVSTPIIFYSDWVTLIGSPNPTIAVPNVSITMSDLVVTGTTVNGFIVQLEKFAPWAINPPILLADQNGVASGITVNSNVSDAFRVKVVMFDPNTTIELNMSFLTDLGPKTRKIRGKVENP